MPTDNIDQIRELLNITGAITPCDLCGKDGDYLIYDYVLQSYVWTCEDCF